MNKGTNGKFLEKLSFTHEEEQYIVDLNKLNYCKKNGKERHIKNSHKCYNKPMNITSVDDSTKNKKYNVTCDKYLLAFDSDASKFTFITEQKTTNDELYHLDFQIYTQNTKYEHDNKNSNTLNNLSPHLVELLIKFLEQKTFEKDLKPKSTTELIEDALDKVNKGNKHNDIIVDKAKITTLLKKYSYFDLHGDDDKNYKFFTENDKKDSTKYVLNFAESKKSDFFRLAIVNYLIFKLTCLSIPEDCYSYESYEYRFKNSKKKHTAEQKNSYYKIEKKYNELSKKSNDEINFLFELKSNLETKFNSLLNIKFDIMPYIYNCYEKMINISNYVIENKLKLLIDDKTADTVLYLLMNKKYFKNELDNTIPCFFRESREINEDNSSDNDSSSGYLDEDEQESSFDNESK